MSAPLSEHTVHVPPGQTCHVRAEHSTKATQIAIQRTDFDNPRWGGAWGRDQDAHPDPRKALYLCARGVQERGTIVAMPSRAPSDVLSTDDNHVTLVPSKTVAVEIGNCGDEILIVTFEIRGEP